jgi:hypothetical protein
VCKYNVIHTYLFHKDLSVIYLRLVIYDDYSLPRKSPYETVQYHNRVIAAQDRHNLGKIIATSDLPFGAFHSVCLTRTYCLQVNFSSLFPFINKNIFLLCATAM